MEGDAAGVESRYWAFISYSHKDAAFGRQLHRRLESYFLPRRFVGQPTAQGIVPRRLAPIFRDREELPAAADLSAEVRAALAQSRSLVVVCSPGAAASKWVSREVEVFRTLHPDRPIFAALRDGDPAHSFPQVLFGTSPGGERVEPLAADFRPHSDGAHLGFLKLVAGITGLGLDELVQRDAQRYRRRVMVLTAAALAALLVMGALTALAIRARGEADRQRLEAEHMRSEAEGLVEFMLTDLHSRLRGVGRLDVMTAVNQRAFHYYVDQDLATLPVDSLERRARILHAMGEDDDTRGNPDAALKKFLEAKRTTAALLAAAPNDPERIFDQAQSEYWVALMDLRRHRFDSAQEGFERYAVLAGRLLAINPANPDWQMEAGYAASNLGTVELQDRNKPASAYVHFANAMKHFQIALHDKPKDADILDDIADGYAWLADSQLELGHYDEARANRLRQTQLLGDLQARDPKNAEYASAFLGNALGLSRIELAQGKINEADKRLSAALADAERLSAADPADMFLVTERITIALYLAKTKLDEAKPDVKLVETLLSNCRVRTASDDEDKKELCLALPPKLAAITGHRDAAVISFVHHGPNPVGKTSGSP